MLNQEIARLANRLRERSFKGEATREEIIYLVSEIESKSKDISRLLEANGAPTRPYSNGNH